MRELFVLLAYLIGSISFSIILVRVFAKKDIRKEGSGNAGATNVLRSHGAAAGISVALLDLAKGSAAVLLMKSVTADPKFLAASAVAVIAGHIFPIFFRFRGGKGVATAVGAFAVLAPTATAIALAVFLALAAVTRYVSVGSLAAAALLPLLSHYVSRSPDEIVLAEVLAALLVFFRHIENLKRLASGTERKLGRK
jgi:glycerol-3-phosphate acyltransferase PlsY